MENEEMAISEKELKLLMEFMKEDLIEARQKVNIEEKDEKIDKVVEKIQKFIED